ncbi:MAG: AAA family ATPase [Actinomycetota bacterium]
MSDPRNIAGRLRDRALLLETDPDDARAPELGREIARLGEELCENSDAPKGDDQFVDGASFFLDAPEQVEAIWGDSDSGEVLWPKGEPMILAGPDGAGKGSVAQQLAFRRAGVHEGPLLGYPVEASSGRTLYVAADRPRQIARSGRRMVDESDRKALELALSVWRGPLPFDIGREPERLVPFLRQREIDTLILDSLGLVAADLASDEAGSRVAHALSAASAAGIEVCAPYHPRKRDQGPERVRTLDDLYGSRWITAAAGSVLYLDAKPGDLIVKARHLKPAAAEVGPLTLRHDHDAGRTEVHEAPDLLDLAGDGITVKDAARTLYEVNDPSANEIEKARYRLDKLATAGRLEPIVQPGEPTIYRTVQP